MHPSQSSVSHRRFASAREIPIEFIHLGSGLYKNAHALWELRAAEDDKGGYVLVRKFEERAVDMRRDAKRDLGNKSVIARRVQLGSHVFVVRQGQVMSATVTMTMDNGQAQMDFGQGDVEVMPESAIVDIIDGAGDLDPDLDPGMNSPMEPQIIEETVELLCTPESWTAPGVDIGRASDLVSLEPTVVRGPPTAMSPEIEPSSKAAEDLHSQESGSMDVTVVGLEPSAIDEDSRKRDDGSAHLSEHKASMFSLSDYLINRWRRVMAHYEMTADLGNNESGMGPNFGETLIVDRSFTYTNPYDSNNKIVFKPGRQFEYDGLEQNDRGEPIHRLTDEVTGQQIFLDTHMLEPNFSTASNPERAPIIKTDPNGMTYRLLRDDEEDPRGPDAQDEHDYFRNMPRVPVGEEESDEDLARAYGQPWVDKIRGKNQPARVRPLMRGVGKDEAQSNDPSFHSAPTAIREAPVRNSTTPAGPRGMGTKGQPIKAADKVASQSMSVEEEFGNALAGKSLETGWLDFSIIAKSDLV